MAEPSLQIARNLCLMGLRGRLLWHAACPGCLSDLSPRHWKGNGALRGNRTVGTFWQMWSCKDVLYSIFDVLTVACQDVPHLQASCLHMMFLNAGRLQSVLETSPAIQTCISIEDGQHR